MKNISRLLVFAVVSVVAMPGVSLRAQTAEEKTASASPEAEAAVDAFLKLRDQKDAVPSPQRFDQLINAGLPILVKYPANRRIKNVITKLTDLPAQLRTPEQIPLRGVWFSRLDFAVVGLQSGDLSEAAKLNLALLAATNATAAAKLGRDRDTIVKARELIDALAALPNGKRLVPDLEMAYIEGLKMRNVDMAEKALRALLNHPDKALVARAADELKLIEVSKAPFDLKFTGTDGKEVNVETVRGKRALYLHFWSVGDANTTKEIEQLASINAEWKSALLIVSVNLDGPDKREAVEKQIKDAKMRWPQLVGGVAPELAERLAVRKGPVGVMVDKTGMIVDGRVKPSGVITMMRLMGFR